jgi:hypothetical protein
VELDEGRGVEARQFGRGELAMVELAHCGSLRTNSPSISLAIFSATASRSFEHHVGRWAHQAGQLGVGGQALAV